jgi:hypothetical protein
MQVFPETSLAANALIEQFASSRVKADLVRFTRHPRALAAVAFWRLQPAARFTLEILLTYADKDGIAWVSPREMARQLPRSHRAREASRTCPGGGYALVSVERALRQLRAVGLLSWERVRPFARFPSRSRDTPGRQTSSGGRIWRVDIERLTGRARPQAPKNHTETAPGLRSSTAGTESGGAITGDRARTITGDRARTITGDRPSDPLVPFGNHLIPRSAEAGSSARAPKPREERGAPGARVASETPGSGPLEPPKAEPDSGSEARPSAENEKEQSLRQSLRRRASRAVDPEAAKAARDAWARLYGDKP